MSNYAVDTVGNTQATPSMALGEVVELNGNKYRYVYNTGTVTLSQYYIALYTGTNNYYVCDTNSNATYVKQVAGVCATNLPPSEYGFVCIGGIHSVRVSTTHTTTGVFMAHLAGNVATIATVTLDAKIGFALGGTAAAGPLPCFIQLG